MADMEVFAQLAALCRQGLHDVASSAVSPVLALFLAGLAGSLVHCIGMCGPFVFAQVAADADKATSRAYGEWRRLTGAALAPYHLGRLTTYTTLGAIAGGATALFASTAGFAALSGAMLVLAAMLMLMQALGLTLGTRSPLAGLVARLAAPLSMSRGPAARYALGLALGLLPCGLLYGALAAAAGMGSAPRGALVMAAFALGTVPAMIAVGWIGLIVRRRLRGFVARVATPLLLGNALLMLVLAGQRFL
jgi:sulfite exporter TauE/SafE